MRKLLNVVMIALVLSMTVPMHRIAGKSVSVQNNPMKLLFGTNERLFVANVDGTEMQDIGKNVIGVSPSQHTMLVNESVDDPARFPDTIILSAGFYFTHGILSVDKNRLVYLENDETFTQYRIWLVDLNTHFRTLLFTEDSELKNVIPDPVAWSNKTNTIYFNVIQDPLAETEMPSNFWQYNLRDEALTPVYPQQTNSYYLAPYMDPDERNLAYLEKSVGETSYAIRVVSLDTLATETIIEGTNKYFLYGWIKAEDISKITWPGLLKALSTNFVWPVSNPKITQYAQGDHIALDMVSGNGVNVPVRASDGGNVTIGPGSDNDWDTYGCGGWIVKINHNNGYFTNYYHLLQGGRAVFGTSVGQNDEIGTMGNSSSCSGVGTHLHFEIRTSPGHYNNRIDPLPLLPSLTEGVTLYEHANYGGRSITLRENVGDLCDLVMDWKGHTPDYSLTCEQKHQMGVVTWSDNASSMKVSPGWSARVHIHTAADADKWGDDASQGINCDQDIPDFAGLTFPNGTPMDENVSRVFVERCAPSGFGALLGYPVLASSDSICDPASPPPSDNATFISDVTLPDGSTVSPGQALVKTWRVQNSGTSTWDGYKLRFVSGDQMGAPAETSIPITGPEDTVDISINLTAPTQPGDYNGYFQIVNAEGGWVEGGRLWVSINVLQPPSSNITLSADPPSPASADQVRIYARVDNFPNLRALRVLIDGDELCQLGAPEITDCVWHTNGYAAGQHAVVAEADDHIGSSWDNPERKGIIYELTGSGVVNHAPYRPILQSPYNWYLKDAAGAPAPVQMCVYPSSDPDGDPVSYWFELNNGAITSGWITSTCWEPTLNPGLYSWRVKAGDGSSESDWSQDTWNFSVAGGGVYIGDINFFAENTNETHMCVFVTYDGIQAPEVRAWINLATDGSESGEWRLLDHYGPNAPPDCTQSNYHGFWIRSPYYETGNHLIRINAVKTDSGASVTKTTYYDIAYIRPPSPVTIAPATPDNNGTWWNTSAITFRWEEPLRAEGYQLRVSTSSDVWNDPTPLLDQSLSAGTTEYTHTFSQDYDQLYWGIRASNSAGASESGSGVWFGIDHITPTCTVQTLPATTVETVFQVSWSGSDNAAGVRSFDIQYLDTDRGEWSDWLTGVPGSRTFGLFTGQPGHTYYFRCRATDNANNIGDYPDSADTCTTIDLTARPQTPWWNSSYSEKRNLVILNNMPDINLPGNYPIHLHFDSTTIPTAEELYNASQSNPKCDDLRIVFEDFIEFHRIVKNCSTEAIDLWFISVEVLAGGSDAETLQLYYGNPNPDPPLDDPDQVWRPYRESDTAYLYFFQEGSGATAFDSSGFDRHCTIDPSVQWAESKFGDGLRFNRANYGDSHSLTCGSAPLSSFTIEFWYKPDPDDGGRIAGQLGSGGQLNWLLQNFEGTIRLDTWECPTCGSQDVRSNFNLHNPPYVGNWNHIAITFNGGNEVKFYINGTLDSTKYLQDSGINTYNVPLEIGSVEGIGQVKANMGAFRISTGVKTNFYYGEFANITNEPTVMVGSPISQPTSGSPDLVILSLTTYPNLDGGIMAQAVVQNQGDLNTQNGFFTDLYVDNLPTGPGVYTGSIQFWVNDPIAAGATVTLTTLITDLTDVGGLSALDELAAMEEASATLYCQTDSTGVVGEPDDDNNIYSAGAEICVAAPDTYEGDDTYASTSNVLGLGTSQSHNFHTLADEDWLKIQASGGVTYTIRTFNLGVSADTYLYLYDTNGSTLLAANDDYGGTLASQIEWTAPVTATYYLAVKHWNPNVGGCGTSYDLSIVVESQAAANSIYLPIIQKAWP